MRARLAVADALASMVMVDGNRDIDGAFDSLDANHPITKEHATERASRIVASVVESMPDISRLPGYEAWSDALIQRLANQYGRETTC